MKTKVSPYLKKLRKKTKIDKWKSKRMSWIRVPVRSLPVK